MFLLQCKIGLESHFNGHWITWNLLTPSPFSAFWQRISKQWIHITDTPCGVSCTGQATVEIWVECSCSYLISAKWPHTRETCITLLCPTLLCLSVREEMDQLRFLLFLKCAWLLFFTCLLTRSLSSLRDWVTHGICAGQQPGTHASLALCCQICIIKTLTPLRTKVHME